MFGADNKDSGECVRHQRGCPWGPYCGVGGQGLECRHSPLPRANHCAVRSCVVWGTLL